MGEDLTSSVPTAQSDRSFDRNILTAARGGGIVMFGLLFDYASRFVFGIVIARALGADGFGLYTLGITVGTVLASVARLGLSEGLVHFLPDALHQRDDNRVRGILQVGLVLPIVLGIGLGVGMLLLAVPLANNVFHDPAAVPVLRVMGVCIPLIALGRLLMASTRGFKYMRYEVYADNIAFGATRLALSLLLLALGWGLLGALLAYAVAWIVSDGLMLFFLNRLFPLKRFFGSVKRPNRQLLAFSAPVCLTQVVRQVGSNIELLVLGMVSTMASVGVYSAAVRIQTVGAMLLTAGEAVAKPIIADLYHQRDWVQLGRLYQTLTRWSLSFILPYFITILLFANPILSIFGEEFERGSMILVIVSLGTLVNAGTGICGAMIVMTGHSKVTFLNSIISAGLSLSLSLTLIPRLGLVGVAVATALSMSLINLIRLAQVYWLHRLWPYSRVFHKPFVATAVALLVSWGVSRVMPAERHLFYLLVNLLVLWSVYVGATLLLRLSDEDRMVLRSVKSRLGPMLRKFNGFKTKGKGRRHDNSGGLLLPHLRAARSRLAVWNRSGTLLEAALIIAAMGAGLVVGAAAVHIGQLPLEWAGIVIVAMIVPVCAFLIKDLKKLTLIALTVDIPLGLDIALQNQPGFTGGLTGFVISLMTIMLIVGYARWLIKAAVTGTLRIYVNWDIAIPALFYLLMLTLSVLSAIEVRFAIYSVFLHIQFFLMYLYLINHVESWADARTVFTTLAVCLFIEGLIMLLQNTTGVEVSIMGVSSLGEDEIVSTQARLGGTLGPPTAAATFLATFLVVTFAGYLTNNRLVAKALAFSALLLGMAALMLTQSRMGLIICVLGISMVTVVAARQRIGGRNVWLVVLPVVFVGVAMSDQIVDRFTGDTATISAQSRIWYNKLAFNVIEDHPFTGVGTNNQVFIMDDLDYVPQELLGRQRTLIHNKYLSTWAETGLFGFLAFVWLLLAAVRRAIHALIHAPSAPVSVAISGLLAGLIAYSSHMAVATFTGRARLQILWLLVALITAVSRIATQTTEPDPALPSRDQPETQLALPTQSSGGHASIPPVLPGISR